ncbi:MAG TPA: response regulator transcription factor, partial [Spirochaetota bacterium]|nr:response regulator transcription factor [Spirochaetota bacterium]
TLVSLKVLNAGGIDLAIADITLKGHISGIDLTKAIRDRFPEVKVLVMSMHDDLVYGERAIKAGAGGYLMKEVASLQLVTAIRTIMAGELYVSEKLQKRIMNKLLQGPGGAGAISIDGLSDREFEVFQLIGNGFSTREIAGKLNVSANTVESHRNRIKQKLNLESSAELSRHAIQWVISQKQDNG